MELRTHLKIIFGTLIFFGVLAILQNILFPVTFRFQIVPEAINDKFPSDLLGKDKTEDMPGEIDIDNQTFSICERFKEINRGVVEKQLFLKVETRCTCEDYYLMRFTRYKLTDIYKLYKIDKPYYINKKGNMTILNFRIDYDIVRADQKGNILCKIKES